MDHQRPSPTELAASASIPTISEAVENMPLDQTNGASGDDLNAIAALQATLPTLDIIQQKFKDNEKVELIFEAYQIKNQEHINRILALVHSVPGGTYAIISLTVVRQPIRYPTDLSFNKVFPINETFQILLDNNGFISDYRFDLCTADESPSKFFYYPIVSVEGVTNFQDFQAKIISRKESMINTSLLQESGLSFSWLNDYRQIGEVKCEMKKRESEYIVYKDIKIYCATWNVNNRRCEDIELDLWLTCTEEPPDIYAIALQEYDLSYIATTIKANRPDSIWIHKMLNGVHPLGKYEQLQSVRMAGIMLTILVRSELRPHIVRCRLKSITRGLAGLANKGAVAVSLQLNEANICFVNSHLQAHMHRVLERNQDYVSIAAGIVFDDELRRKIDDHDHIFWIGDLNYRIQKPAGLQLPAGRNDLDTYELLLQYDQLRQEMRRGNCFKGYTEGAIKFNPTYKYDPGTDTFDTSEKCREPAYCDRVLWKGSRIELLCYNSVMELRMSDHKPVYAMFNVKIKTRDEKKYKRVQEEVLKAVDKRENENQPQISIDQTVLNFGLVRFNEQVSCYFTVSNNCPLSVNFKFKAKDPPISDICEKWLQVDPREDSLLIDSERRIRVTMLADDHSIRGLLKKIRTTRGKSDLDILILHVENGPDSFIPVTGEYKPSCFGLSMETLCRTDRPINEYSQEEIRELMNDLRSDYRVTMPREFFLLLDYLHKQGPQQKDVFRGLEQHRKVHPEQLNAVRDWLDTWSELEFPGGVALAAKALIMLLDLPEEALLEPVVGELLASRSRSEAMEYIAMLSTPKCNVFLHLCMFLREGIEHGYFDLEHSALFFGRILLRGQDNEHLDHLERCRSFMRHFIGPELVQSSPPHPPAGTNSSSGSSSILAPQSSSS